MTPDKGSAPGPRWGLRLYRLALRARHVAPYLKILATPLVEKQINTKDVMIA